MNSLISLIVVFLIKLIVRDLNKPVVSEVDQLINKITKKKPIKYFSNGIELKTNLTEHYFNILNLENGKIYDREMILTQVQRQDTYYQEDVAVGYETRCNSIDILLAEEYIMDNYNYVVYLN